MMAAVRTAAVRAAAVETAACYGKQAASLLGSAIRSAMANVLEHVSRTSGEFIRRRSAHAHPMPTTDGSG